MATFKMPVDNYKITSKYNPARKHPVTGKVQMHAGIDLINTKVGKAPIYATASGKVRLVKTTKDGYGKHIIITHDIDGIKYESVYAHLDSFLVVQGDLVKQGDRIAYMGNTGIGTGVHLHFELHKGTYNYGGGTYPTSFDPEPYVTQKEEVEKVSKITKVSKVGLDLIKKYEGLYLNAYLDPIGLPTIGYGTTKWENGKAVKLGETITKDEAARILEKQVNEHASNIYKYVTVNLNQNQFDALASFCYNLGSNILAKDPALVSYINKGDSNNVARVMKLYNKANGKTLEGLLKRRTEEATLYLKGVEKETINEEDEILKFSDKTTENQIKTFIEQGVKNKYFGAVWNDKFKNKTMTTGDLIALEQIAQNKKSSK